MAELDTVVGAVSAAVKAHGTRVLTLVEEQQTVPPARLGQLILLALLRRDADRAALEQAVTDVAGHPGDPDAVGSLRWQVKKAMAADPVVAGQLRDLLRVHAAVPTAPVSWRRPVEHTQPVDRGPSVERRPVQPGPSVERGPVEPGPSVERRPQAAAHRSRPAFRSGDPRDCPSCGRRGRIAGRDSALRECSCGNVWDMECL